MRTLLVIKLNFVQIHLILECNHNIRFIIMLWTVWILTIDFKRISIVINKAGANSFRIILKNKIIFGSNLKILRIFPNYILIQAAVNSQNVTRYDEKYRFPQIYCQCVMTKWRSDTLLSQFHSVFEHKIISGIFPEPILSR